ncbi:hypothetical protein RI367_008382 [Sorochytrium milnesiophthora]
MLELWTKAVLRLRQACWSTMVNPSAYGAAQAALQFAEERLAGMSAVADAMFPPLPPAAVPVPLQDVQAYGKLPADFKDYYKKTMAPDLFLEKFESVATRTCTRSPPEDYHCLRILAVILEVALRKFIQAHIIGAGLSWSQGRPVFLRREVEPAAYISNLLDILNMGPIDDSVEAFVSRWLPELDELGVHRDSFLAKLLLAKHLKHVSGALAEAENDIFDPSTTMDGIVSRSHTEDNCFDLHPDKFASFQDKNKHLTPKVTVALEDAKKAHSLDAHLHRMEEKEYPATFELLFLSLDDNRAPPTRDGISVLTTDVTTSCSHRRQPEIVLSPASSKD